MPILAFLFCATGQVTRVEIIPRDPHVSLLLGGKNTQKPTQEKLNIPPKHKYFSGPIVFVFYGVYFVWKKLENRKEFQAVQQDEKVIMYIGESKSEEK